MADGSGPQWRGVLAPLGVASHDGRVIAPPSDGQVRHRDLPLPLLCSCEQASSPSHRVGQIDRIWIATLPDDITALFGEGRFAEDPHGQRIAEQFNDGRSDPVAIMLDGGEFTRDQAAETVTFTAWRVMAASIDDEAVFDAATISAVG